MDNHPNRGLDSKIRKKLEDKKLYAVTYYAMALGAGTIMMPPSKNKTELDRHGIIISLSDALRDSHPTEWESEIGKMVMACNVDGLTKICKQLQADHPSECPSCRNTSRVNYRSRTSDYVCWSCRFVWPKF